MYLKRNIDARLVAWKKNPDRCPLLLRGARQVGKSATIKFFGKQFESIVTVDFELSPEFCDIFTGNIEPQYILMQLEPLVGQRIIPGQTLLFLDEIQECPRAITSLRYFKEKLPQLHVIAAGSLLEFILGSFSFPVGRIEYDFLYPMSFQEFLNATDRGILLEFIPKLDSHAALISVEKHHLTTPIADKIEEALKEYMIVGGMPEAVRVFSKERSLVAVESVHDRLILSIRDDIPKYTKGALQVKNISRMLTELAKICGQQITYTKLLDDDSKRNKDSVFLLAQAMYVHLVHSTSAHSLPLGANSDEKTFKSIFFDIGLAQKLCGRQASDILRAPNLGASFQGQLAEQFVGQQLLAESNGSELGALYYWKRHEKSSSAEVDFILARQGHVVPVEVKAGASGRLRSLHLLLNTAETISSAICLQSRNTVEQEGKIVFAPLYTKI